MSTLSFLLNARAANKQNQTAQKAQVAAQKVQQNQNLFEQLGIQQQYTEELSNLSRKTRTQSSTVKNWQADLGISGNSMLREQANIFMQEAFTAGSLNSKQSAALGTKGMQSIGDAVSTQNNINQLESKKKSNLSNWIGLIESGAKDYMGAKGAGFI